jgi:ribosomal protein S18 acetylase RimI-like enzyme
VNASPEVRIADIQDRGLILDMRQRFYSDQLEKGLLDVPLNLGDFISKTTDAALSLRRAAVFLAWNAGSAAGYLLVNHKFTPTTQRPNVWTIEELFIERDHRGTGAGEALTKEAVAYFKSNNADRIQLRVLEENSEGRRFWLKQGFKPTLTLYEL